MGRLTGIRVTLVAADGRVVGDSTEDGAGLAALENHGTRPEIQAARAQTEVLTRRYSTTTDYETLYAVVHIDHPTIAFVRLSLPLTEVAGQQRTVLWLVVTGVAAALPVAALFALARLGSAGPPRRIHRRRGASVCDRRPHTTRRRLRRRRARRGRACARWRRPRTGPACGRPRPRSPSSPRDSLGDGGGSGRARSAGSAGDGQRRGQQHAEARRRRDGAPLPGMDAAARAVRADRASARGRGDWRRGVRARARPVAHVRVARRAGRRARGRGDPRAARHQRPAARGSGTSRLRRQRLARTAHAPHRHSRLCRGAARRPARARGEPAVPRDHRAPHDPHGASGEGPAPPGPARRRTGDARDGRLRRGVGRCRGSSPICLGRSTSAASQVEVRLSDDARTSVAIPPSCTTCCGT